MSYKSIVALHDWMADLFGGCILWSAFHLCNAFDDVHHHLWMQHQPSRRKKAYERSLWYTTGHISALSNMLNSYVGLVDEHYLFHMTEGDRLEHKKRRMCWLPPEQETEIGRLTCTFCHPQHIKPFSWRNTMKRLVYGGLPILLFLFLLYKIRGI